MISFKHFLMDDKETKQEALLEAGLSRIAKHLKSGGGIGIVASATGDDASKERHRHLIKRARQMGYGPIVATGHTKDWGKETSLAIPNITPGHLKQLGNEFKQQAVIHATHNSGKLHYLDAEPDKEKRGSSVDIGKTHFNQKNAVGITMLRRSGWNPPDPHTQGPPEKPNRSFTFKEEECVLESIEVPPTGQLNPHWKPYI